MCAHLHREKLQLIICNLDKVNLQKCNNAQRKRFIKMKCSREPLQKIIVEIPTATTNTTLYYNKQRGEGREEGRGEGGSHTGEEGGRVSLIALCRHFFVFL